MTIAREEGETLHVATADYCDMGEEIAYVCAYVFWFDSQTRYAALEEPKPLPLTWNVSVECVEITE